MRRGLGRAVLWLQSGAVAPDRDLILRACRENWMFDRHAEDNRALYMADIVRATGESDFFVAQIIEALFAGREDDSYSQFYELTGLLAADHAAAREALYAAFTEHRVDRDCHRAEVLMNLDGLDGYLFAVETWIRDAYEEDDHFSMIQLLNDAEERFGADAVADCMARAARADPAIANYHAAAKEHHAAWRAGLNSRPPRPVLTYENLRALAATPSRFLKEALWANRGRPMDDETAGRIALDLLTETDPTTLAHLLCLFGKYEFPGDPAPLFAMALGADETVARAAAFALAAVVDPGVRALGLEIMDGDIDPWRGVRLLIDNYEPGDCRAMLRLLERLDDPDAVHWLGISSRDVFDQNPSSEFAEVLQRFYEKGMCAMCRSSVVDRLLQLGPLPEDIRLELPYDASDMTREAAIKLLKLARQVRVLNEESMD